MDQWEIEAGGAFFLCELDLGHLTVIDEDDNRLLEVQHLPEASDSQSLEKIKQFTQKTVELFLETFAT